VPPIALSPHNPRIERVRDLRATRARTERGRFVLEGPTLLAEALRSGIAVEELYGTDAALHAGAELVDALERAGTPVYAVPERTLSRLSDVETPPGLVAVAAVPAGGLDAVLARPGPVVLLCAVGDPGNAGTLVRSAEAFGAAGVVFGRGGADPWAPKVVRAAMGSLFRLPVAVAGGDDIIDAARRAGRPIVAAVLDGEPLGSARLPPNAVLAIGNERHGVAGFLARWDRSVRIEQASATDSLNAAVAGSILLYALSQK
jgi:TrmH family RNA methyltransferase